ncbi:chromate efflux transporter [Deinococcus multiflagellatus]|uniref:Chromate efflux transporter n=1 Tax=Deinococcus multiflagellatus TaxID=1656887 RepID=A0ABW1ZGK3_9DEIO|nr:chromate efflux transporter [Deinococcus multiflagellatus]
MPAEGLGPGAPEQPRGTFLEVLLVFGRLGLTSFGGPVAHLGYFREEFVRRRRWLDEGSYAELVALCQFLPGPASSQVGMALGIQRAGLPGALAAWLGFTLPSAALLALFALGVRAAGDLGGAGWLHGLKLVAVAVVAQAVLGMARSLTPDRPRALLALGTAAVTLLAPWTLTPVLLMGAAGLIGWRFLNRGAREDPTTGMAWPSTLPRRVGTACLGLFGALLLGLPLLREVVGGPVLGMLDSFYRAGALVFGGGHVVLPLLEAEVVSPGWVTPDAFLAGYGAAQAVPGPLFTFSAYLGAVANVGLSPLVAAGLALGAIFLPAFLLVAGALPFWGRWRTCPGAQAALQGVNAAVVGVLLSALYTPVFTAAVGSPLDFAVVLVAFAALEHGRLPPWLVVGLGALVGWRL